MNVTRLNLMITNLIILVVLALFLLFGPFLDVENNDDIASKAFRAQMYAISDNNSEAKKLGLDEDYETLVTEYGDKIGLRDFQKEAVEEIRDNFEYEIMDVIIDEDSYTVVYKVDSYPLLTSAQTYHENYKDYLTEEEQLLYEKPESEKTTEEKRQISVKILDLYKEGLKNLKPTKEIHAVEYIVDGDEVRFADEEGFKNMYYSIIGLATNNQYIIE